jgi:hypothetical protein
MLSFFQSWCFVGFVAEVLGAGDVYVELDDLLRHDNGEIFLTTASLPRMLNAVTLTFNGLNENAQTARMKKINDALTAIDKVTSRLCNIPTHAFSSGASSAETPASLIYLSVLTLLEYLDHFAIQLTSRFPHLQAEDQSFGGQSQLVAQRMLDAGWCANEIARLRAQGYRETTLYYLGFVGKMRIHGGCTEEVCRFAKIDETAYRTRHVIDCSEQHCQFVDVDVSSVVRERQIPILTVVEGRTKGSVEVLVTLSRASETATATATATAETKP